MQQYMLNNLWVLAPAMSYPRKTIHVQCKLHTLTAFNNSMLKHNNEHWPAGQFKV